MSHSSKILIVEDDGIVAEDISESLRRLGYEHTAVAHAAEAALCAALDMKPDLVLMDVKLKGGLDGIQTAERIRKRLRVPIVYLTANADPETLQRAKLTEPFGYLLKPYNAQELQSTIEMALFKSQMEERLRESEFWLASTLRDMGDAVIATDASEAITFMNPAAEKLTGYAAAEVLGKPLGEIVSICDSESGDIFICPVSEALRGGRRVDIARDVLLKTPRRGVIAVGDSAAPIRGESGGVIGAVLVLRDMTGRRQMEEKLQHSQKMEALGRLAGGVAHDFSNLLNVILGYSARILADSGDKVLRKRVNEIRKAGERAMALTRQLLAVSRKPGFQPKVFDLRHLASELHDLLASMMSSRIELKLSLDGEPALIRADPGQIEQVLMNLVLNGRDAISQAGALTVEVRNVELREPLVSRSTTVLPGHYVLLAVSDTGCGMHADVLGRLFEPFFTTKEKGKGTGLGLTAVYSIVNECDAGIVVESQPGRGSRFAIYFQRQMQQETALPGSAESANA
ncbi:MAG TPA: response regulator [Bryobacteraceae bacterium]|nr:response regulator [Bryobacteraceae bacterium]